MPSSRDRLNPGIKPRFPALQVDSLPSESPVKLLVIALCSSPVIFWNSSDLMGSSSGVIPFCLFILSMRFSRHEFWSGLPFSPSADCVLSELSTMTRPSRVALHGMAHGSLSYASPFATTKLSSMKGVFNLYLRFLYHIKQLYHSEFSLLRFHSSCNPLANSTT